MHDSLYQWTRRCYFCDNGLACERAALPGRLRKFSRYKSSGAGVGCTAYRMTKGETVCGAAGRTCTTVIVFASLKFKVNYIKTFIIPALVAVLILINPSSKSSQSSGTLNYTTIVKFRLDQSKRLDVLHHGLPRNRNGLRCQRSQAVRPIHA